MPHRPRLLTIAAILLTAATSPANAQFDSDTLDSFVSAGFPRIAANPVDGAAHVTYERMGSLRHRWLDAGVWLDEEIASGGSIGDVAVGPTGRVAAVQFAPGGLVVVHRRDALAWSPDTIPTTIPVGSITFGGSLAIDSADDPVFVWLFREPGGSGSLIHLRMARRSAGAWSVAELDTSRLAIQLPSLALDQADRPRLSISLVRGFNDEGPGTYYGEASGALGPWTWTLINESIYLGGSFTALALDPVTDEPRMAYELPNFLLFAYRAAGVWRSVTALYTVTNSARPVSIALSPSGSPRLAYTLDLENGGNHLPAEPSEETAACGGGIFSPRVFHFERALVDGEEPFTFEPLGDSPNSRVSPRGLISTVGDESQVIWRDPWIWQAGCTNHMIYSQRASTVGVPIPTPPDVGLAIGPNPLRGGAPLTVAFRLARDEAVTLRLIDVAGRTIARSTQRLAAGSRSLSWAPPGVASGAYRLVVDAGVTRLGSRSVVVID